MVFERFFKKKKTEPEVDPITGLTLESLKTGYYVDYDMKTWQVISTNTYDWGEGDITYEWQLESHDDTLFLEREVDDDDYWSICRKQPFKKLDAETRTKLLDYDNPPESLVFDGKTFYLEETGGALFYKDNSPEGKEVFKWDFCDETGKLFVTVEQWDENDYELVVGEKAHEYQFSNILPAPGA